MGGCAPSSDSTADSAILTRQGRGESVRRAQFSHALPVRPSWKNMPMIAIIASLPLASSERSFLALTSGSPLGGTLKPKSQDMPEALTKAQLARTRA